MSFIIKEDIYYCLTSNDKTTKNIVSILEKFTKLSNKIDEKDLFLYILVFLLTIKLSSNTLK